VREGRKREGRGAFTSRYAVAEAPKQMIASVRTCDKKAMRTEKEEGGEEGKEEDWAAAAVAAERRETGAEATWLQLARK